MSTKKIPEKVVVTCDGCGVECGQHNRAMSGGLKLLRDALDFQGHAVASGNMDFDFCDSCLGRVTDSINREVAAIREEVKP